MSESESIEEKVLIAYCDKCKKKTERTNKSSCLSCIAKEKSKPLYPDRFLANDPIEW